MQYDLAVTVYDCTETCPRQLYSQVLNNREVLVKVVEHPLWPNLDSRLFFFFLCEKVSFQAMKIHEENLSAYFLVKEVTCPVTLAT